MPKYHLDNVSRIEDIEGLLTTALGLASRLPDEELNDAKACLRSTLSELRAAKVKLITKWRDIDRD